MPAKPSAKRWYEAWLDSWFDLLRKYLILLQDKRHTQFDMYYSV